MNIDRRDFLQRSSLLGASFLLPVLSATALPIDRQPAAAGFQLKFMATNWGFEGTTDAFCARAKAAGYDGIEVWWTSDTKAQEALFAALQQHQLEVGFLCGGSSSDPATHLKQFREALLAATSQNKQRPLYINCHSGRDYFTFAQNRDFIDLTVKVAASTGIPVYHETHRSRILFAAHVAREYLEKIPGLQLTLDISHWCNVHESLLQDQEATVKLALARTGHIHARIGHPEGPQVNDPRAPEWEATVKAHLSWWDQVMARKKADGQLMTVLTEFGPADYMPALPYTRQPVANQWEVNVYMMNLLKQRYNH
ncbi:sugar phosphate isomerase/epimerase family protein [Chitinophaga defluvii]|uniref:TIM barrel protein n=1 Tax=Chitinophaga defluvii TaxID=3163343 RepID=A0ABV2T778_9BACT